MKQFGAQLLFVLVSTIVRLIWSTGFEELNASEIIHPLAQMNLLPKVYIVPINKTYNTKCVLPEGATEFSKEHLPDVLIHEWLLNVYPHKVENHDDADLFFLPFYTKACHLHLLDDKLQSHWNHVNTFVWEYVRNQEIPSFVLDKAFMVALYATNYPNNPARTQLPNEKFRTLYDLRYLRFDNYQTVNARDVYMPYTSTKVSWATDLRTNSYLYQCKNDKATNTQWHKRACQAIKKTFPTAKELEDPSFSNHTEAWLGSDFCFIFPENTPSSPHLFKAIAEGCIPVFFSAFKDQLPFIRFIDWTKFSIIVLKDIVFDEEAMSDFGLYMNTIANDKEILREYKKNLELAKVLFDYSRTEWPSLYHLTLMELKVSSGCGTHSKDEFAPFDDSRPFYISEDEATKKEDEELMKFVC